MSTFITPYTQSSARKFALPKLARSLVHKQLNKLHAGQLILKDAEGEFRFGAAEADLVGEIHIQDEQAYSLILTGGSVGAAEAFMTGDWVTPDLTALIRVMVRNMDILDQMEGGVALLTRPLLEWFHKKNENTENGSKRNIAAHYDLGNDFFKLFLDPTMMYSSGVFPNADATMQDASENKLRLICEKLDLKPTDRVVEIGTGWGGFAVYAAKHYGCHVTTTTISEEQYALAVERVNQEGLADRVTLLKEDYRLLEGQFDKLVTIEMIEAVGWQYYPTFFEKCASLLKDDGQMLMQAITIQDARFEMAKNSVDFIKRYIFPGSCIPSIQALNQAALENSDLRMVQQEDFAGHYARTLRAWWETFQENIEDIQALGYDETFQRMWQFYLCYCEGGFIERAIGVSHLHYAKPRCENEPFSLKF